MHKLSKFKIDKGILFTIITLALISIITISSAQKLLQSYQQALAIKQTIWYILGFVIAFFIMYIGNNFIYKHIWMFYVIGVVSLIGLLLFAAPVNDAKCWYTIPGIGAIQPSEFMKIILILTIGSLIHDFNEEIPNPTIKEEFIFLLKVGIVILIPSVLTFLQPDTGVVLIYLLITISMLFVSGIRIRWFVILGFIALFIISFIVGLYLINSDLFIRIFGSGFFLRINRLLDWSNGTGYQLKNGMAAIGSGGLLGFGFFNTPIYFPEPQTDFIFAVYANNTGFIGSLVFLSLTTYLDIKLIFLAIKINTSINKYVISGIVGMLIYQQLQNIGMTIGLMPITGITLPFISYGGSSLLSYMIMAGIIFNISSYSLNSKN